jgi:hypothetical protein
VAILAAVLPASRAGADSSSNPCDLSASLPQCVAALGPLQDITADWSDYQAAPVQAIPISDYAADPEDASPPLGVGTCGAETSQPAAGGAAVPQGTVAATPPAGVPSPPGSHGPYCVLRYLAADFAPPCPSCHRVLIDYTRIPDGTAISPGAGGHFALRLTPSAGLGGVTAPFNGHSPNIKNLCSDKFVNPSPGAQCDANPFWAQFDQYGLGMEGDAAIYHHFPTEGRYYNGPAYLAGDGMHISYHWVRGAYVDLDTGSLKDLTVWYSTGYRGRSDAAPDTDQSYGCACEVPPVGHSAFSPDYALPSTAASGRAASAGSGAPAAGSASPALPNTAALAPPSPWITAPAILPLGLMLLARRRNRSSRAR